MKKLLTFLMAISLLVFSSGQVFAAKGIMCTPSTQTVGPHQVVEVAATENLTSNKFIPPSFKTYVNFQWFSPGGIPDSRIPDSTLRGYYIYEPVYPLPGTYAITVVDPVNNVSASCTVIVQ